MLAVLIKSLHTLAVLYFLLCLYVIWQYALNGLHRRWLRLALVSVLLEAGIYAGNGFRCPLTDWAIALGDSTGADYIQEWFFRGNLNFVPSFAIFATAGMVLAGRRWWLERRY